MKIKKLILMITLMVVGTAMSYAQKQTYKFLDAQSRAGDAVTEVLVKPTVVEVKLKGGDNPQRMVRSYKLSREEVEVAMQGQLDNIRGWATYKANEDENSDVIMAATYKVETNDEGGYTVTIVGYPAVFSRWYTATEEDYEWIRIQKLASDTQKGAVAPVVKNSNFNN